MFAAYAAGAALLLITLAVLAAVAGHTVARALHRVARYAGRIAGALLALSGAYLLTYWLPQLLDIPRLGDAGVAELAGLVATAITDHQLAVALTAALLMVIGAIAVIRTRRARTDAPRTVGGCCLREEPTATITGS